MSSLHKVASKDDQDNKSQNPAEVAEFLLFVLASLVIE